MEKYASTLSQTLGCVQWKIIKHQSG